MRERAPLFHSLTMSRGAHFVSLARVPDFLALTKYKWARHASKNTKFVANPTRVYTRSRDIDVSGDVDGRKIGRKESEQGRKDRERWRFPEGSSRRLE